jgi:hypothetical protein
LLARSSLAFCRISRRDKPLPPVFPSAQSDCRSVKAREKTSSGHCHASWIVRIVRMLQRILTCSVCLLLFASLLSVSCTGKQILHARANTIVHFCGGAELIGL